MSISMGKTGRSDISEINMTPMIDVLLVLLVIFMIAQPLLQRSIDVQLPLDKSDASSVSTRIVLEIDAAGAITINTQPVAPDALDAKLREIYANRPDKIMFIKANPEVEYQVVIGALDAARGAGVEVLGAMLPKPGEAVQP